MEDGMKLAVGELSMCVRFSFAPTRGNWHIMRANRAGHSGVSRKKQKIAGLRRLARLILAGEVHHVPRFESAQERELLQAFIGLQVEIDDWLRAGAAHHWYAAKQAASLKGVPMADTDEAGNIVDEYPHPGYIPRYSSRKNGCLVKEYLAEHRWRIKHHPWQKPRWQW